VTAPSAARQHIAAEMMEHKAKLNLDGLTRRLENAARTAHLRGGLDGQPAGLENLSGLLAGLHDK